jgi:hypothetical protein
MGALDDFLAGEKGVQSQDMSQPKTLGITDDLLDRLRIVEGGKEKFPINKKTKAMGPYQFMPDTVQMLHKQGYEFNPFNEEQARGAAKHYLEQLVKQNKGDVNKAVAQYGGHITADPTKYVNAVVGKQPETKPAQSTSALDDFLNQSQELGPPVKVESSGGVKEEQAIPQQQTEPTGVRTRAGVPVKDTSDVLTGAIGGLARTVGGAARGAVTTALGLPGDINRLIVENIGSALPNAPAVPTTEQIQKALPGEPTTQEGKVAQQLGAFIPVPLVPKFPGAKSALEAQFAEKIAPIERIEPTMEAAVAPTTTTIKPSTAANQSVMAGVGAARSELNPYTNKITGEETAREVFPTYKLSKTPKDVNPAEQKIRAKIVSDVLGEETGGIRPGVLTGNENTLRDEYTLAKKADTKIAQDLKEQFAKEQVALSDYAKKRIENTGANKNFIHNEERGQVINDAFAGDEGLIGWFKNQKQNLYDTAKTRVGDNPINTGHVDTLLENKQFRAGLGLKGNEGVAKSAQDLIELAKNTGFEDQFGKLHPANSISAWDAVRKALNKNWTKDNADVISKINQAIDKDIAAAGGEDLYKAADKMHEAEKNLFGSKGIKDLFGEIDVNGVEKGIAFGDIPKKLATMPPSQFRHVYDLVDQLSSGRIKVNGEMIAIPEDTRIAAQAAKNEIAGVLTRDIYQAGAGKQGVWSYDAANKRMNALDLKLRHVLPPEEYEAMHKLNIAGHLMPSHGYEGAALQTSRVERLAEKLPTLGAALGAKGGMIGSAAGEMVGKKAGKLIKGKSEQKAAERLRQQMEENFRKGRE